jgi:hypothetical protein
MLAHSNDLECAICYTPIVKTFFMCSAPCGKVFHVSCMEQTIEQTEEVASEMDQEPEHKCCYCRRTFNIKMYSLQLLGRYFINLKAGGYNVEAALDAIRTQLKNGEEEEFIVYNIYEMCDLSYMKKPKQSKRAVFQKKTVKYQPRIRIKQNIGGRRR